MKLIFAWCFYRKKRQAKIIGYLHTGPKGFLPFWSWNHKPDLCLSSGVPAAKM